MIKNKTIKIVIHALFLKGSWALVKLISRDAIYASDTGSLIPRRWFRCFDEHLGKGHGLSLSCARCKRISGVHAHHEEIEQDIEVKGDGWNGARAAGMGFSKHGSNPDSLEEEADHHI